MSDLALTTSNKIVIQTIPTLQRTGVAGEDITAGAPVYIDGTTGKFMLSDANDSNTSAPFGIAAETVYAGAALTAIRIGVMSGWSNLPAYGSTVFVSNTAGALADAAGSTSMPVGIVVPVFGTTTGTAADKAMLVQITL